MTFALLELVPRLKGRLEACPSHPIIQTSSNECQKYRVVQLGLVRLPAGGGIAQQDWIRNVEITL